MDDQEKPRRSFIKKSLFGTLAVGAGMSILAPLTESFGVQGNEGENDPNAKNEKQFRMGLPNYRWRPAKSPLKRQPRKTRRNLQDLK